MKNIKTLYESREKVIKLFNDFSKIASIAKIQINSRRSTQKQMPTPKQMLQRLSKALAQVRGGNTSEKLLNQLRQIIYYLY